MAIEYRGSDFLYVVEIPASVAGGTATTHRPFNQTDGSHSIDADDIEISTKDKTGSDYGDTSESISFSGLLTEGDPAVDYLQTAIRERRLVRIIKVNTRTSEAESGLYKLNSFGRDFGNGDFATYSIDATLNGAVEPITLTTVPAGAPDNDGTA